MNRMKDLLFDLVDKGLRMCDSFVCDECDYRGKAACTARLVAEHLEFNGVMLPPCKIGDIVYVIPTPENGLKEIEQMKCLGFEISAPCPVVNLFDWRNKLYQPSFEQFGVSVFASPKEARSAAEKGGAGQ